MHGTDWEARISAAWESFDELSEADFLALIEKLAAELPPDSGIGFFKRASSLDSTGHPDMAVPLYRQALEHGLEGPAPAPGGHPDGQFAAQHRDGRARRTYVAIMRA